MPTNRKRKSRKIIPSSVSLAIIDFFTTGNMSNHLPSDKCDIFLMCCSNTKVKAAWESCRDQILSDWIKKYPCSRPWPWWEYETLEIRRRVGGVGDLWHDIEDYEPLECHYGIPWNWITIWEINYYGDLRKTAVDPKDPPVFESETAYLLRHELLTPAERAYLKKHPELLEPERIEFNEDDED